MFRRRRIIGILGNKGVGKTTYLVMLLKTLSNLKRITPPRFEEGEEYFFAIQRALFEHGAPPSTKPASYYFKIRAKFEADGKKYELITVDLPGGEIERLGPYCRKLIDYSHGIIFLIEPINDAIIRISQVKTIYRILDYMSSNWRRKIKKPIAIAFSKNDIYNINDPAKTFWEYTSPIYNLVRLMEIYVEKYAFFAISSLGAPLEELRSKGLLPAPKDVEKPFLWIISNL